jgi:P-type conjugative transfer protein TrbJ
MLAAALLGSISSAAAQFTVFDPVNYQQNLVAGARALAQINNQLRQLQGDAEMLARMEQNLTRLTGSISPELKGALTAIQNELNQGTAIALRLKATEESYEQLFPREIARALSDDNGLRLAQQRWQQEYASLERAARLQGQIGDAITTDSGLLAQTMDRSRAANGALEVAQAGNELSALAVKQALTLQGLLAAQQRSETLKSARDLAGEEEARQRFKVFLGNGASKR